MVKQICIALSWRYNFTRDFGVGELWGDMSVISNNVANNHKYQIEPTAMLAGSLAVQRDGPKIN